MSQAVSAQAAPMIQCAGLWARTRAIIPDLIIVTLLQALINTTFGSEQIRNGVIDPSTSGGFSTYTTTSAVNGSWLWLAAIAYFSLLDGAFGMTVGKAIVGLRVADRQGRPPGWRAVLTRNGLRVIDWIPAFYLLGALVARFSAHRQRIGDPLAGTLVVPTWAAVGPGLTAEQRRQGQGFMLGVVGVFLAACAAFSYFGRPPIVLGNLARAGQFPGGLVASYQQGPAQWRGGSVTFPVTYTLISTGKTCTATITLDWHGFVESWQMSRAESRCS